MQHNPEMQPGFSIAHPKRTNLIHFSEMTPTSVVLTHLDAPLKDASFEPTCPDVGLIVFVFSEILEDKTA
jgi:hypothetical protein